MGRRHEDLDAAPARVARQHGHLPTDSLLRALPELVADDDACVPHTSLLF